MLGNLITHSDSSPYAKQKELFLVSCLDVCWGANSGANSYLLDISIMLHLLLHITPTPPPPKLPSAKVTPLPPPAKVLILLIRQVAFLLRLRERLRLCLCLCLRLQRHRSKMILSRKSWSRHIRKRWRQHSKRRIRNNLHGLLQRRSQTGLSLSRRGVSNTIKWWRKCCQRVIQGTKLPLPLGLQP